MLIPIALNNEILIDIYRKGSRNPVTMTKTFEKTFAMSRHRPLLVAKLIFPLFSSTPVTIAARQAHTSWLVMSWVPGAKHWD